MDNLARLQDTPDWLELICRLRIQHWYQEAISVEFTEPADHHNSKNQDEFCDSSHLTQKLQKIVAGSREDFQIVAQDNLGPA